MTPLNKSNQLISVVIPFFNEGENIYMVCEEVQKILESSFNYWEVILVNDGSTDNTDIEIDKWADNPNFKVVHLNANMGQSAALFAGFEEAEGMFIFTLDGDGQNDPADIPVMFEKLNSSNADMVCGVRTEVAPKICTVC
jgi:dolichol-phosphate mannosyltransferase